MEKQKIAELNRHFRIEELQERLEYKVTKPGRDDWYDMTISVTVKSPTQTTTAEVAHVDW